MIKIKLLQLEKSCCQICLFEDMLDSYYAVVCCHFLLTIHAFTDVFQNNLSALKHIVITPTESVKKKDDNKSAFQVFSVLLGAIALWAEYSFLSLPLRCFIFSVFSLL